MNDSAVVTPNWYLHGPGLMELLEICDWNIAR